MESLSTCYVTGWAMESGRILIGESILGSLQMMVRGPRRVSLFSQSHRAGPEPRYPFLLIPFTTS